jgi:uncharacterized membrane protein
MIGALLGKVVALPLRVVNVPAKLLEKAGRALDPDDATGLREVTDRVAKPLSGAAKAIESAIEEALDE